VYRIVVVDNGSTDDTGRIAAQHGAEVVTEPRRGYGTAILAGIAHLHGEPPDIAVILDADGADPPKMLDRLVAPILDDRADFVLSDRTVLAEPGSLGRTQRYGNRFATRLMAMTTGHRYRDMGPFRAIRWTSLIALDMGDPTWGWNVEMQMKAVKHRLRIKEIPLPYRRRERGKSKISGSLSGAVRAGYRILQAVHRHR
jgi:glycosyltransferase involved in cell wall biosynthesis